MNENVVFPEDLSQLSSEELTALESRALAHFDTLAADEEIDDSGVEQLETLVAGIETLRAENQTRVTAAANIEARQTRRSAAAQRAQQLRETPPITAGNESTDAVTEEDDVETPAEVPEAVPVAAKVTSSKRQAPSLAAAQTHAPRVTVPGGNGRLTITASAPTSGVQIGTRFDDMEALVAAVQSHAKSLVPARGAMNFLTVASIQNDFPHVIHGERTSANEFERMMEDIRNANAIDDLVAGGGWCAPSELRYDFFNIACEDGMVDLPTFGVQRGGINFPVSPSLADVFTGTFNNTTNPWLWSEADDILVVTGSTNKPCIRVPCPSFTDVRLECYGICLTAGNLTDSAYPESTRNHLKLLMSAHYHAMNQRYLAQMQTLSTAAIAFPTGGGESILSDAPDAVAVAAQDYRTRFGMCDDDVLEVVLPRWVRDAMRSDHLRRTGFWENALTDSEIDALFKSRRVRVQWVNDWQIRGSGQFGQAAAEAATGWPATVDFMIYAAGTFVRGNGMTLDLGVVRDSVLNAENDHTASWSEECHLIARYGHESRRYRIPVCVAGRTGSANVTNCHLDA